MQHPVPRQHGAASDLAPAAVAPPQASRPAPGADTACSTCVASLGRRRRWPHTDISSTVDHGRTWTSSYSRLGGTSKSTRFVGFCRHLQAVCPALRSHAVHLVLAGTMIKAKPSRRRGAIVIRGELVPVVRRIFNLPESTLFDWLCVPQQCGFGWRELTGQHEKLPKRWRDRPAGVCLQGPAPNRPQAALAEDRCRER